MSEEATKQRVFKYNNQTYEDPGAAYSTEDVKKHLASIYPEVAQAEIQTRELGDGRQEVTFIKKAGTKG
jgi:PRTRC genetic system protein C